MASGLGGNNMSALMGRSSQPPAPLASPQAAGGMTARQEHLGAALSLPTALIVGLLTWLALRQWS